jgi:hypothetical protein
MANYRETNNMVELKYTLIPFGHLAHCNAHRIPVQFILSVSNQIL